MGLLDSYKVGSSQGLLSKYKSTTPAPAQKGGSFLGEVGGLAKDLVRDIASPVTRIGVSGYNAIVGGPGGMQQTRDLPFFGPTKGIAPIDLAHPKTLLDPIGVGADFASNLVGGEGLGGLAKTGIKGAVIEGAKVGAKEGAIYGATQGFGKSLQAQNPSALGTGLSTIGGAAAGAIGGAILGPVLALPKSILNAITDKLHPEKALERIDSEIVDSFNKAVKPSIIGQKTTKASENYAKRAVDGIKNIVENKSLLKFPDENGQVVSRLPKNTKEFASAIDQIKSFIFSKYNAMTKGATGAGVEFDTEPVLGKLRGVAQDLSHSPETRDYAKKLAQDVAELNGASPDVVEKRIADFNKSLGGFYAGRVAKTQAELDASVASALRDGLDKIIETAQGPGYQDLKNQYGALKQIEKDVNNRAIVWGRKNAKGLFDLTDIFSGGQITRGILTMNPAEIASGGASKIISEVYKYLNSPDRIISNMFDRVDSVISAAQEAGVPIRKYTEARPQLLLNAPPTGAIRAQINAPVPMGARSQSTIDQQEIARIQAQLQRQQ